jgi:amino acid transporter
MSLSIVGPSMAMAFNVSLAVRFAGRAAPLAFGIATIALGMVALAFVRFSRPVAHAGSAYAYVGQSFGWRWGFVAGWTLLLTCMTYAAAATTLIGNFFQAAVQNYGFLASGLWFSSGFAGLLLRGLCAYRNVKLAGRLMVVLEALSVAAIIFLSLAIVTKLHRTGRLAVAPFLSTRASTALVSGMLWSSACYRSPDSRKRQRSEKRLKIHSEIFRLPFLETIDLPNINIRSPQTVLPVFHLKFWTTVFS